MPELKDAKYSLHLYIIIYSIYCIILYHIIVYEPESCKMACSNKQFSADCNIARPWSNLDSACPQSNNSSHNNSNKHSNNNSHDNNKSNIFTEGCAAGLIFGVRARGYNIWYIHISMYTNSMFATPWQPRYGKHIRYLG